MLAKPLTAEVTPAFEVHFTPKLFQVKSNQDFFFFFKYFIIC